MAQASTWFPEGLKGRHVLYFMLAFFGVDIAVCATMIWFALGTFSGVGTESAYQRGLRYNETLAKAEQQTQLGWRTAADYDVRRGEVVVTLTDRDNRPLPVRRITVSVGRPTTDRFDQAVELHYRGDGRYAAPIPLSSGRWDVRLQVGAGADSFEAKERLWVNPQ